MRTQTKQTQHERIYQRLGTYSSWLREGLGECRCDDTRVRAGGSRPSKGRWAISGGTKRHPDADGELARN